MFGFFPFSGAPFSDLGSVSVSVDLTGVVGTGQVGTVAVTGSAVVDVTGLSATGQVGSVTVEAGADVGDRRPPRMQRLGAARGNCYTN